MQAIIIISNVRHTTISQTCFLSRCPLQTPALFQRIIGLISQKQAPVVGSVVIFDIQYLIFAILAIQYLISQQQVPGGVFPFLQLLQVDIFDFPSGIFEKHIYVSILGHIIVMAYHIMNTSVTFVSDSVDHTWQQKALWCPGYSPGICKHIKYFFIHL